MGLMQEFKEFALKGNVVDLAVGLIIGGGFGKIISSLVEDVIMPPVGLLTGGVNFTDLKLVLNSAALGATGDLAKAVTINYGKFIQVSFDFIILAFCVFMLVKVMNKMKRAEAVAAPAAPAPDVVLLTEIRDLLRK
jgi:large conductance mechanosensitive channel